MAEAERVLNRWPTPASPARTTWSPSAAASSATSPDSAPTSTSAGSRSSRCRPRWSPRSTPPTAARPVSTCPQGKNYAGAYHLPAAVLADTGALATLPRAELRRRLRRGAEDRAAGRRRALGAGAADRALDPAELDDVVFACARYKCEVVAADERDVGLRQALNLGHTVGHAIEAATGYRRYRHGEAVGLGLLAALRLSGGAASCATRSRRSSPATGCRPRLDAEADRRLRRRRSSTRCSATRSAPPPASASSSSPTPGQPRVGQLVDPARVRAAVEELLP